jgi:SAM-dependent methyltransferase
MPEIICTGATSNNEGVALTNLGISDHLMTNPPCPITGDPAIRHVQSVTSRLLIDLWRYTPLYRVDARPSFKNLEKLDLWESPTGLYFFDPRPEGDHAFYASFYQHIGTSKRWASKRKGWRREFDIAAGYVKPQDRVLDVGCAFAGFRDMIPQARYTGLDPNFADEDPLGQVLDESLGEHVAKAAGTYDVVCAFQVVEHLADPLTFYRELVLAAKPGGVVVVSVPQARSAMTRIPNWLVNAPPHHLTWWTKDALMELSRRGGAEPTLVEEMQWSSFDSLSYWIERCSPIKATDRHYKGDWWWHGASVIGWAGGLIANTLFPVPKGTAGDYANLLMVARKAG